MEDRPFYGRLVENAVGAAFLNAGDSVFYWSERKDKEVDFIVQRGKDLLAVEVTVGDGHPTPGLKTFLSRYPETRPVLIGGENADLSVEQFLERGL